MACPTCDHTMQNLGVNGQKIFWCNRCGTIKTITRDYEEFEEPIWIQNIIYAISRDGHCRPFFEFKVIDGEKSNILDMTIGKLF